MIRDYFIKHNPLWIYSLIILVCFSFLFLACETVDTLNEEFFHIITQDNVNIITKTRGAGNINPSSFEPGQTISVDPVVFIHGNSMADEAFYKQLSSQRVFIENRVYTYDLRGHGDSSDEDRYYLMDHARDLKAVLDYMDMIGVTLVGWSLGGNVALQYLQDYPNDNRVNKLVLVGTTPDSGIAPIEGHPNYPLLDITDPLILDYLNGFYLDPTPTDAYVDLFVENLFPPETLYTPTLEEIDFFKNMIAKCDGEHRLDLINDPDFSKLSFIPQLKEMGIKILIYDGGLTDLPNAIALDADGNTQVDYMINQLIDVQAKLTVHEHNLGHMPFYMDPLWFNDTLSNFLE
jgi:pimeloyl-ACP methyl ester carboxylesterase